MMRSLWELGEDRLLAQILPQAETEFAGRYWSRR